MTEDKKGELLALAERCEAAQQGGWTLNNALWLAVGEEMGGDWAPKTRAPVRPSEIIGGRTMADAVFYFVEDAGGVAYSWHVPDFTSSLDAAMTLVDGVLLNLSDIGADGLPYAVVGNPVDATEGRGIARTLPLTLAAAALRARATTPPVESRP